MGKKAKKDAEGGEWAGLLAALREGRTVTVVIGGKEVVVNDTEFDFLNNRPLTFVNAETGKFIEAADVSEVRWDG